MSVIYHRSIRMMRTGGHSALDLESTMPHLSGGSSNIFYSTERLFRSREFERMACL